MLEIEEYVDIRGYTTFKVGGQFRYFVELSDPQELPELYKFAQEKNLPVHILGGGSNIIFPDGVFDYIVAQIQFCNLEIISDTEHYVDLKAGAGENWDYIVENAVDADLSGIEAMSAIPGTVGATPVQNVGAYGQEIKDTLVSVDVFDIKEETFKTLSNADCGFSYRNSIFKGEARGKYVITAVTLRLLKDKPPMIPNYPGVKKYFLENNINNPTLLQIREAIIEIRKNKLPDPKDIPSAGSFFKNTIVSKDTAKDLKNKYPDMVLFDVNDKETKVPSGFLIEKAGLKGKNFGTISSYQNNAMVLINNGGATRADVERVRDEITQIVLDKFGVTLEAEPEFV
ncbi:MAG: UDP-N-acetylmuramate dehydrogenase [Patescibacteria group bacterium]